MVNYAKGLLATRQTIDVSLLSKVEVVTSIVEGTCGIPELTKLFVGFLVSTANRVTSDSSCLGTFVSKDFRLPIQLNIAVLSFGILQSALLSVALLRRKSLHPSAIYLILFLVVVGLQLTFKVISKSWLWDHARTVYMISYNYGYLVGPLIYLFFRSLLTNTPFNRKDWLHFIPFTGSTILTIADEVFGIIYHLPLISLLSWVTRQLLLMIVYCIATWRLAAKSNAATKPILREFLVYTFAVEMLIVITITVLAFNNGTMPDIRFVFISLTLLVYWITYKLISKPDIFSDIPEPAAVQLVVSKATKYSKSGLRAEDSERIVTRLKQLMDHDQAFAAPGININDIAQRLSVNRHHLSQAINQHFGRSFTDLVNMWRLNEAKSRLSSPRFREEKISAIAFDLGFSSVSVFTTMFRKHFGVSPSTFRNAKNHDNSSGELGR
jgi:AraC-like DNA-binding protein